MNIFHKIAVLHYINTHPHDVRYNHKTKTFEIIKKGFVRVQKMQDFQDVNFCMEYNLFNNETYVVGPCDQTCFDKSFIQRMYKKMQNNCNGR